MGRSAIVCSLALIVVLPACGGTGSDGEASDATASPAPNGELAARLPPVEQIQELLCRVPEGFTLWRLPPADRSEQHGYQELAEVSPECDEVTVEGRLREFPPVEQVQEPGWEPPMVVPDWYFVSMSHPQQLDGWVSLVNVCVRIDFGPPPVCGLDFDSAYGRPDAVEVSKQLAELLPIVSPAPIATNGLPDLVATSTSGGPRAGDPCSLPGAPAAGSSMYYLENHGTAATPDVIDVVIAEDRVALDLTRGLEPDERMQLGTLGPVLLDPENAIEELDETNNDTSAPGYDPNLVCR